VVEWASGALNGRIRSRYPVNLELYVTAQRHFRVESLDEESVALLSPAAARVERAFLDGQAAGLLHLATVEIKTSLPPGLSFARAFAQRYATELCHLGEVAVRPDRDLVTPPAEEELAAITLGAPPLRGLEYLDAATLGAAWRDMDAKVRSDVGASGQGVRAYLHERNPLWRLLGRVTFHLAENRRDEEHPFAFLATYAAELSERGEARHLPLVRK
jgi:hypothetical protein